MADNITGFGGGADEVSLGLNINSNVGNSINDFNTLDQVLQQMNKDGEIFNNIQSDSFEKAKAATQELRNAGEATQQLISIFKTLRGEQQGIIGDAKQLTSIYQQFNSELSKSQQTQTRMGITGAGAAPGVPGSSPGAQPINTSSPSTQAGGAGGGSRLPPGTGQGAGFAEDPDNFFGREEVKSGGRGRSSGVDIGALDVSSIEDFPSFEVGTAGTTRGTAARGATGKENYKQLSDLALSMFPGQGYYSRLRRARWLTRNEGKSINKFIVSDFGKKVGLALNRLGGGQRLSTSQGYQLFPFTQDENGNYIDDSSGSNYGLKDSSGNWIRPSEGGFEGSPWSWSGEGPEPSINLPQGVTPKTFNPWERPNLNATGEGAAKIAGAAYALRLAKNKASDVFREGQLYTGITGGTGVAGALGYDIGAQLTSWFGLNPLESYGQAKQITMQNLALGYRGNLLGQANAFGNQALQKYGVDPQTSMQMFGQMVMQAGASLEDLNASLATLAHTTSTTNTSFSQLQQNVIQYSQIGANIGLTGGENATFATAAAQFAAGQPGLGATGANPADILDSMIGQALVAQQMGTSYLGLPGAAQQQGAAGLIKGEIKANEQLFNNMGITRGNYADSANYQRFKLVMASLGRTAESKMPYGIYLKYMKDLWDGKTQRELRKTITSQFAQAVGGRAGESASQAIASAVDHTYASERGIPLSSGTIIGDEMNKIESQNKWKNIGVDINGKFTSLKDINAMPTSKREALEAMISTGAMPISHISQHGKLIKGTYGTGTLSDLRGQADAQFHEFGENPNRAAMLRAERGAMRIELGPKAQKYLTLLEDPSGFNRHTNNWAKSRGLSTTPWGNQPTGNNNNH